MADEKEKKGLGHRLKMALATLGFAAAAMTGATQDAHANEIQPQDLNAGRAPVTDTQKQMFEESLKVNLDAQTHTANVQVQQRGEQTQVHAHGVARPGEQSNNIDQQILNKKAEQVQAVRRGNRARAEEIQQELKELYNQKMQQQKANEGAER